MMGYERASQNTWELQSIFNSKKNTVTEEINIMLKESMIRSMYYKMIKYMDSQSIEKMKELQKLQRYWETKYRNEQKEHSELYRKVRNYERLKKKNDGKRISFDDLLEEEAEKAGIKEKLFNI